jgi:6-methylpretetramide 4-monooxygenase / 4-hydroxy-6-methylpretetramide 12a-monooxygenase
VSEGAVDVLVVGAGPSGLFAALELARHGVHARVIERDPHPHRQARATAIQPGTLEILAAADVLDETLASSVHLCFARVFDAELQLLGEVGFAGAGSQWDYMCSLPQWRTEEILFTRLGELGGTVERGVTAISIEPRDGEVLVALEHADGRLESACARWVIGAGGAHSLTRASMEEDLIGATYPGVAMVADLGVRCALERDASNLLASPRGYVLLAPLPEDRWLTFVGHLEEPEIEMLAQQEALDAVSAMLEYRLGDAIQVDDVTWASGFRMHRRLASRLVGDHLFLLGDAGHLSSPFGGEGLNSGLQDGHNLAWKLALELRGRARPPLLESFGSERLAADRHVLHVSDVLHQLAQDAVEFARTGSSAPPPNPEQAHALLRSRSMLDVSYAGSPLAGERILEPAAGHPHPGPGDRFPDRAALSGTRHHLFVFGEADAAELAQLGDRWGDLVDVVRDGEDPARAGLARAGAVLVRPDGHVGFRTAPADADGLRALDAHLDSYMVPAEGAA